MALPGAGGIRTVTTEINGVTYSINTLDANTGLEIFGLIADYLTGPLAAGILSAAEIPEAPSLLVHLLADMARKLRAPDFRDAVWKLLGSLAVNGRPVGDAQGYFAANYGLLTRLAFFALRANFASFQDGIPAETRAWAMSAVARLVSLAEKMESSLRSSQEGTPASETSPSGTTSTAP